MRTGLIVQKLGMTRIFNSEGDPHPDLHGSYLIACLLFAAITDESPLGLPSKLDIALIHYPNLPRLRRVEPFAIEAAAAEFLQQLAWEAYRCRFDDRERNGGVCPD